MKTLDHWADELNQKLTLAETAFTNRFTVRASLPMAEKGVKLTFDRKGDSWGLFKEASPAMYNLFETSLEFRIEACHRIVALWEACEAADGSRVQKVETAVQFLDRFLESK